MARAWAEHEGDDWEELNPKAKRLLIKVASIMLDSGLGFLTDHAEAWAVEAGAGLVRGPDGTTVHFKRPGLELLANLIAALSDSRDTGEKP